MKKIDAAKWPLACASILLMTYIIIIDNALVYSLSILSIVTCIIFLVLTIGNIFYFENNGDWQQYKLFGRYVFIKNAKIFILISIIMILFVLFALSNRRDASIIYVYSIATFYCASLIRVKL